MKTLSSLVMVTALTVLVAILDSPADACCNVRSFDHAATARLLDRAELLLARGDLDGAWKVLEETRVDFHFSTWRYTGDEADMPLLWRGELVYGAIVARSDGRYPLRRGRKPTTDAKARRRNLWEAQRGVDGMTPASWHEIEMPEATATAQAAVSAELRARQHAAARRAARKVLERIAREDRMPTPFAWATLAGLRARAGDTDAAKAALATCVHLAWSVVACDPIVASVGGRPGRELVGQQR